MIIIDKREMRSIVPKQLEKMKLPISYEILPIGDYLLKSEIDDKVQIPIERKSMSDYVGSLVSRHLNNSLYELSTNFAFSIIMVEGYVSEVLMFRKIKRQTYLSSLAGSILKRSPDGMSGVVQLVNVETVFDSALFINELYSKINDKEGLYRMPELMKFKMSEDDRATFVLSAFPNIGDKRAKILLNEFGCLQGVFNATRGNLEIKGIPKGVADDLFKIIRKKVKVKE